MFNLILIVLIIAVFFGLVVWFFRGSDEIIEDDSDNNNVLHLGTLTRKLKEKFDEVITQNVAELNLTKTNSENLLKTIDELDKNVRTCAYGNLEKKNFVKDYHKRFITKDFGINESNIDELINFNDYNSLTTKEKFDILLYCYKVMYKRQAFTNLLQINKLDQPIIIDNQNFYEITVDDIDRIFKKSEKMISKLKFSDKLEILAQRTYEKIHGHSVVDELRDMDIDGLSGGVGGIPDTVYLYEDDVLPGAKETRAEIASYNSIWVLFRGNEVKLSCIGFETERELIRVCSNIYRFDNPGQLHAGRGFIANQMEDGSRIVVMRPPFSTSWCFFLRKFGNAQVKKIEELYPYAGAEKLRDTCKWLIRGNRVIAITGGQGCGKTTFLVSLIQFYRPSYTLRSLELTSELHLSTVFPDRNIVAVFESGKVTAQDAIDILKKSSGNGTLIGEVATHRLAALAIESSRAPSDSCMFTSHHKTTPSLIKGFAVSLMVAANFKDNKSAEMEVCNSLQFDFHLTKDSDGNRYVQRITQIVPLVANEVPNDLKGMLKVFIERMTDWKQFECVDIIRYENDKFVFVNCLTDASIEEIKEHLTYKDKKLFDKFIINMREEVAKYKGEDFVENIPESEVSVVD